VPLAASLQPPVYARFGEAIFAVIWLVGAVVLGWRVWRQ
jgi:hypothetical protein